MEGPDHEINKSPVVNILKMINSIRVNFNLPSNLQFTPQKCENIILLLFTIKGGKKIISEPLICPHLLNENGCKLSIGILLGDEFNEVHP